MNQKAWQGKVEASEHGKRLDEWLVNKARLTKRAIQRAFVEKRVLHKGAPAVPDSRTMAGQIFHIVEYGPNQKPPGGAKSGNDPYATGKPTTKPDIQIVFLDSDLVVVNKPHGLTTSRNSRDLREFGENAEKFLPPTLADWLPQFLPKTKGKNTKVFPVHRLDRETSGLLVFALNEKTASALAKLFKKHDLKRSYLALTRNVPPAGTITNELVRDRGDGRRGSGSPGEPAITHVELVEQHTWGAMVRCTLETGRTHQVRIHLAETGAPLCGEKVYDRPLHGKPFPDPSEAPRIMLHAHILAFEHPVTRKPLQFEIEPPKDFHKVLKKMRGVSR